LSFRLRYLELLSAERGIIVSCDTVWPLLEIGGERLGGYRTQ